MAEDWRLEYSARQRAFHLEPPGKVFTAYPGCDWEPLARGNREHLEYLARELEAAYRVRLAQTWDDPHPPRACLFRDVVNEFLRPRVMSHFGE